MWGRCLRKVRGGFNPYVEVAVVASQSKNDPPCTVELTVMLARDDQRILIANHRDKLLTTSNEHMVIRYLT